MKKRELAIYTFGSLNSEAVFKLKCYEFWERPYQPQLPHEQQRHGWFELWENFYNGTKELRVSSSEIHKFLNQCNIIVGGGVQDSISSFLSRVKEMETEKFKLRT